MNVWISSSFSILYRIELGETVSVLSDGRQVDRLSVSSIGSSWVKQIIDTVKFLKMAAFSILYRIELGETPEPPLSPLPCYPFSILYRIELGETSRHRLNLRG